MVRVIEQKSDADEMACVEFRVYRKPTDPAVIFGEMFFIEQEGPRAASISTSDLGIPVDKAFLGTVDYANQRGIPFIWIDDPRELFPPTKRPALS
jgi:hypothetical protein